MRIFAILVLLVSIVIDIRIALPYSFFSSGSGFFAAAARNVANIYILSAVLQIIAVVLLALKKENKILLVIATVLIGLVAYSYFNHVNVRNFVAAAAAIAIYGAIFSWYIAHTNDGEDARDIMIGQIIYAVVPTLAIIFVPLALSSGKILDSYNEQQKRNEANEVRQRQQREAINAERGAQASYRAGTLRPYHSSASGNIKGGIHSLPITDSLTIFNRLEKTLTIYLLPTNISLSRKKEILGGWPLSLMSFSSPDPLVWKTYPYGVATIYFNDAENITPGNINRIDLRTYSIDGDEGSRMNSRKQYSVRSLTTFKRGSSKNIRIIIIDNDESDVYSISIEDQIHYY
jgi:hypothetical protein